jgi:DNA-binding CsgD family transcriptional regulator
VEQGSVEAQISVRVAQAYRARARGDARGIIDAVGPLTDAGDALPILSPLSWWVPLIGALVDDGHLDLGAEHIERLDRAVAHRGLGMPGRLAALRARLARARGEADVAEAGFRSALTDMDPDEPALERALVHHDLGRVLLRARGNRRDAIDQLRSAHDLFASFGAEPYRQRVEADLAAAGLRAAAGAAKSPLALTDRERDVAALVSTGLTNKEVAADLYISTKAVEYHLRNIYGKLGISSRRELAASLALV